ncbi:multicopper oxidase [Cucurbitaria berberidis CBS 394.84]|uniref:Multicopper oxidase n=1 Tax=Cucurbitaria berberidis CBS 394.84 TaxID=1168544 RepID=A0A9P4L5M0_9PLEO|nr:multicopper oxidase [Cucurbitaria berberidis CBS 394.84]KAF1843096.1 multicopper oxidase [Cucurbitaria berberidis CBS 394.84]
MVAYAPYVAVAASLSSVYHAVTPSSFTTPTVCQAVTATVTEYATATITRYATIRPTATTSTTSTTTYSHGLYNNPYNNIPLPFEWPGKPSEGEIYAPPQPPTPYEYGGPAKDRYEEPCWIPKGVHNLTTSLNKGKQSGSSRWGEIDCPHLPVDGLPGSPSYQSSSVRHAQPPYPYPTASGYPYNSANATRTMYTHGSTGTGTSTPRADPLCPTIPDTGVTRTYKLHVAYQTIAPDGVTRNGVTINGQFPGPLVEANWGDWIKFEIKNDLTNEGTTIHAHGLFQKETSWYDGVPAVAQCPIMPNGGTFEMLFRADRYGSSWYHSHYSGQYSGGAHGPMVIYGPKHQEYDIDIGPIILEDWFHADYFSLVNQTMNGRFPPSNNNLINGRMNYPCANTTLPCTPNAGVSKFQFQSGKKHLLRLINAGAEGNQKFSIDGHQLKVIAVDFIPVEPYTTNVVTLAVGQRTDIIVEAIGKPSDIFWMRSQLAQGFRCTLTDGISPNALAAVYYEDADTDSVPATTSSVTTDQLSICKNDELTVALPLCKIPLETPDHTERIDFEFKSNGTNFIWYLNNSTYRGDYNAPTLLKAKRGETDFKAESNVYQFPGAQHVRLHLVNHGLIGGHPIHMHGHDFHVLAEGFGDWDGTVVNSGNTQRRDVHQMQNARNVTGTVEPSFMVMQFVQDNPGAWPLHCHLAWHVSGGLFMQILERPEDIVKQDFDTDVFGLCDLWDAYSAVNPPNQIDSGL